MLFDLTRWRLVHNKTITNPQQFYFWETTKRLESDILVKVEFSSNFMRGIFGLKCASLSLFAKAALGVDQGFVKEIKTVYLNDFNLYPKPYGFNYVDKFSFHFYRQLDRPITVKIWEYNL